MNKFAPRIGIFETNSSSSHSFALGPTGRLAATITEDPLEISTDMWDGPDKFNDPLSKLSYLLCFAYTDCGCGWYVEDGGEEEKKRVEKYKKVEGEIIKVVKEFTGIKEVKVDSSSDTTIDHQSTDIIDSRDLVNPEFIKEFVFNPDTWVYPIWDSYDPGEDFWEHKPQPLLYTMIFSEITPWKPKVEIRLGDSENKIKEKIMDALMDFAWDGEKYHPYERYGGDVLKPGWEEYSGDFKYGEHQIIPDIIFPEDD